MTSISFYKETMQKSNNKTIVLTRNQHRKIEDSSDTRLQAFQRKIYVKACNNPKYKFYCLYDKVLRTDVLHEAYRRVRKNKGAAGIDKETFADIEEKGVTEYLTRLQEELQTETYRPSELRAIQIPKDKNKTRTLRIPTIKDRIVQMAIKLIIEPIYESNFEDSSYGYRPKKEGRQAVGKINKEMFPEIYKVEGRQREICSIDLSNCFDTIPQKELIQLVAKRITDRKLLKLINRIIKVKAMGETIDEDQRGKGTPQGGVLSPLLANIYLDQLDKYWEKKETKSKMMRYADDMVILLNKEEEQEYQEFLNYIEEELDLIVNREKTTRRSITEGFDFLGFTIRTKTSRRRKRYLSMEPSKKSMSKIRKNIKEIIQKYKTAPTEVLIQKLNEITIGWQNYFDNICMGKTRGAIRNYLEWKSKREISRRNKSRTVKRKLFRNEAIYEKYKLHKLVNLGRKLADMQ